MPDQGRREGANGARRIGFALIAVVYLLVASVASLWTLGNVLGASLFNEDEGFPIAVLAAVMAVSATAAFRAADPIEAGDHLIAVR